MVLILFTQFHHHHCLVIGSIFRPFHRPRCPTVPSSIRPCHLLPIFTARGWIFTDEWSQQQHQYFQRLSKTNTKTCWRFNHLSLKGNHLEGKAWECRQQPVLTNVHKSKSCQCLCQRSCLWANQRGFFGDNEYLEMGRKLSQFIDLGRPDPGDFYFGWLASLCTEEAQKSMDGAWAH